MNSSKLHTPSSANTSTNSGKASASKAAAASTLPFANVSALSLPQTPTTTKSTGGGQKSSKPSGGSSSQFTSGRSTRDRPDVVLPQTKVKAIMKTSPQVENIGHDALYLITKSTELFIDYMASQAFARGNSKSLEYKQLSELAQTEDNMEFLKEIIPRKVPARQALQEVAKQKEQMNKELKQQQ